MNYSDKLKNPKWQKKRLKIFERDDWTCRKCDSTDKTLNVHHLKYEKNKDPWEYKDKDLITYCDDCHKKEHGKGELEKLIQDQIESTLNHRDFEYDLKSIEHKKFFVFMFINEMVMKINYGEIKFDISKHILVIMDELFKYLKIRIK